MKYFGYCKICRIIGPAPRQVRQAKYKQSKLMKTNTLSNTLAIAVVGTVGIASMAHLSANSIPLVAEIIGYFAVVALVAVAAIDYRAGPRSYVAR